MGMIDPLTLQSLLGTLNPQRIEDELRRQQDEQLAQIAQHAQAANADANTAGGALTAATSAPIPQDSGFADQLLGNVASVLGKNPAYSAQAATRTANRQNDLMEARKENLVGLRDIYEKKAAAAERLGNFAEAEKARVAHERVARTIEQMDNDAKLKAAHAEKEAERAFTATQNKQEQDAAYKRAVDVEAMRQKGDLAQIAAKQDQSAADYLDTLTGVTRAGNKWLDATNLPKGKDAQAAALRFAKANGLRLVDPASAKNLQTAEEVFRDLDEAERVTSAHLVNSKNPVKTAIAAAKNVGEAFAQTNEDLAAYGNFQDVAIRHIQALAAGVGSGFRLSQKEIDTAVKNFPKITDNLPTANRKLKFLRNFLENKQSAFFQRDYRLTTPLTGGSTSAVPAAIDQTGTADYEWDGHQLVPVGK